MSKETREYAKQLVSQMTLEEKMSQMVYQSPAIERLGIPAYNWWNEALHGVARAGVATVFPQAIGLAATFDKELLQEIGDVVSTEGRAKFNEFSRKGDRGIYKGLTFWAPNVNIFRDPRWGRGHETYGEDPYLTGELGCAYIRGLQGPDPDHPKAAACAKHFAVHSGPEAIRHEFDARVSRHDLYDTYLYAFKRCVKDAKVEAVMGAYNRVNGEPACGSKTLLKDILRDEFGFEGHVVSDCWAIMDFHEHHRVTKNVEESAARAVNNGCDLNCGVAFLHLPKAYEDGLVSEEAITAAVERLMEIRIRLGMMKDYPSPYEDLSYDLVECKEHVDLSVEAARRSMVLLKNENNMLPLDVKKIRSIAVIGPNANSRAALVGNYQGTSSRYITPLEGIQQYIGDDVRVTYAEGCHLYKNKVEGLGEDKDRFKEAVIAAEHADVVVLCLGLDATVEGEEGDAGNEYASGDKLGLNLPGLQEELLETITAVGKPVVLVLSAGSAWDSVKDLVAQQEKLHPYNGVGCFNDMDMLIVGMHGKGNVGLAGCSDVQYQTHYALWAFLGSPLMIGCDIREMSDETRRILMNDEMIRINQDPLCRQPYKVKNHAWNDNVLIYVKALANGDLAIGMFNLSDEKSRAAMNLDEIGLPFSTGRTLELTEVWTGENLCANNASLVTELEPFASKVYRAKVVKL